MESGNFSNRKSFHRFSVRCFYAKLAMEVLNGEGRRTIRYAVGLNAGAVLYLCGKARTLKDGYNMALEAIDSGKTLAKLQEIQSVSKQLSPQEDVA